MKKCGNCGKSTAKLESCGLCGREDLCHDCNKDGAHLFYKGSARNHCWTPDERRAASEGNEVSLDNSNPEYVRFRERVIQMLPMYLHDIATLPLQREGTAAKALFDACYTAHLMEVE